MSAYVDPSDVFEAVQELVSEEIPVNLVIGTYTGQHSFQAGEQVTVTMTKVKAFGPEGNPEEVTVFAQYGYQSKRVHAIVLDAAQNVIWSGQASEKHHTIRPS